MNKEERVQKIISMAGLCSRRAAEKLISQKRVTVNGKVIVLGDKANLEEDLIKVDGKIIKKVEELHYYMFNKPRGYLTSFGDPNGRPTIESFFKNLPVRVFPVGRLDMDVEGLLILTNDGKLAKRLMHPSYEVPKVYLAKVRGLVSKLALKKLTEGSLIVNNKKVAKAKASVIRQNNVDSWVQLTLIEGRRRQVKIMLTAVDHPVLKLKRVAYANLKLNTLAVQSIRKLSSDEVKSLKKWVDLI